MVTTLSDTDGFNKEALLTRTTTPNSATVTRQRETIPSYRAACVPAATRYYYWLLNHHRITAVESKRTSRRVLIKSEFLRDISLKHLYIQVIASVKLFGKNKREYWFKHKYDQ